MAIHRSPDAISFAAAFAMASGDGRNSGDIHPKPEAAAQSERKADTDAAPINTLDVGRAIARRRAAFTGSAACDDMLDMPISASQERS